MTRADGPVDMTTLARKEQEMGVGRLSALGANLPLGSPPCFLVSSTKCERKGDQGDREPLQRVHWPRVQCD